MKEFALKLLIIKESFSIPKNTLMKSERRKAKEDKLQFHDLRVIHAYTLEGDCRVIDTQCYILLLQDRLEKICKCEHQ